MKTDKNGCSICPEGQENYETFVMRDGKEKIQYDYRTPNGKLFSTVAPTLQEARDARDQWLKVRNGLLAYQPDVFPEQLTLKTMKNQKWYVSASVQQDEDTMLFTKRVKIECLNMNKDRTIAHIDGITLEEAEEVANAVSLVPKMISEFINIQIRLGDLEGERELTYFEKLLLDRVNKVLEKLKPINV